jgi:hypothetical protein
MRKTIRRLRLREGDIVVVKDTATMHALVRMGQSKGVPNCPIVFAPSGISRLSREYLRKLIDRNIESASQQREQ